MTKEDWLAIEVGDIVIDHSARDARREVVKVSRVTGRRGQPKGYTRTVIQLPRLYPGLWRSDTVSITSSEDIGGKRFTLEKATTKR